MADVSPRTATRAAGAVLLVAGLWLTHTLRLLGRIGSTAFHWAAGFVFDPVVWLGVMLGVVGVGLLLVAPRLGGSERREVKRADRERRQLERTSAKGDDIDEVLKKYGIK